MKPLEAASLAAFVWRFLWTERNIVGKLLFLALWPMVAVFLLTFTLCEVVSNLTRKP